MKTLKEIEKILITNRENWEELKKQISKISRKRYKVRSEDGKIMNVCELVMKREKEEYCVYFIFKKKIYSEEEKISENINEIDIIFNWGELIFTSHGGLETGLSNVCFHLKLNKIYGIGELKYLTKSNCYKNSEKDKKVGKKLIEIIKKFGKALKIKEIKLIDMARYYIKIKKDKYPVYLSIRNMLLRGKTFYEELGFKPVEKESVEELKELMKKMTISSLKKDMKEIMRLESIKKIHKNLEGGIEYLEKEIKNKEEKIKRIFKKSDEIKIIIMQILTINYFDEGEYILSEIKNKKNVIMRIIEYYLNKNVLVINI